MAGRGEKLHGHAIQSLGFQVLGMSEISFFKETAGIVAAVRLQGFFYESELRAYR